MSDLRDPNETQETAAKADDAVQQPLDERLSSGQVRAKKPLDEQLSSGQVRAEKPLDKPSAPTARKWPRRLLLIGAGLLLLAVFGPQIASTGLGRGWLQRRLSKETRLQLQIGAMRLAWWRPIELGKIQVATPDGVPVGSVASVRTQKSLWGLATAGLDKGEVYIERPEVRLDLTPDVLRQLQVVTQEIKPDQGLLGKIVNPHKDTRVTLVVHDGTVAVRPDGVEQWQTIVERGAPQIEVHRENGSETLSVAPGEICHMTVSPVLCDWGLSYVLPVLAGAVDTDGACTLHLTQCRIDLKAVDKSQVEGELHVEAIRADVEGPLLRVVTDTVVRLASEQDAPVVLHLSEDCHVPFGLADGRVFHEGLRFGLPRLLPNLGMETSGSIGLDQSLDLYLESEIPFDKLGEGEVLQRLGSPRLSIPIAGTLSEPRVDLGKGKIARTLIQDLVQSLAGADGGAPNPGGETTGAAPAIGQVDAAAILQSINDLGLVRRLAENRKARETRANENPANEIPLDAAATSGEENRPGILQRIRERGGLLRRRRSAD